MGRASRARCGAVWSTATVVALALIAWLRPDRAVAVRPGSLEEALAQGGSLTAAACVVWLWCVTTLAVGEAVDLRSPAGARRSLVSRLVLVACGAALSGAVAVPAHAEPPHPPRDTPAHALHGLALPDRPTGGSSSPAPTMAIEPPAEPAPRWSSRPGTRCGPWRVGCCRAARVTPRSTHCGGASTPRTSRWSGPTPMHPSRSAAGRAGGGTVSALGVEAMLHRYDGVVPLSSIQGTLALDLSRHTGPTLALPSAPSGWRGRHRGATAPPRRAVGAALRTGGGRDRRRRPTRLAAGALDQPRRVRRPVPPRPARRARLRPGSRSRPGGSAIRPQVVSVRASFVTREICEVSVRVRHGKRFRAVAARFEVLQGRLQCTALEFA